MSRTALVFLLAFALGEVSQWGEAASDQPCRRTGRKGRFAALPNAYLTVTPEERALRSLLNRYRAGEFDQAIARLATTDAQLRQDALATTLDRLGEAIAAHNPQRPKTAAARDAQLFARYLPTAYMC
jgi:hypothetical protein